MWKSSGQFDRSLEKATSHLLLEPDWDATLQICDSIRQGDVQTKYALSGIRKRITNDNPHVAKYALQVLESVVKNCGSIVQSEIATKEFMEFLKEQAKTRPDLVKGKVLELIQVWSHAFRNIPTYRAVQDMYHLMKAEDFHFPVMKESDAMFSAEKAPEWKDGDCCHRCRVPFGMMQRKHHCRNCGQIFCGKCTTKSSIIPKFGIEKEVRVCDSCHDILVKPVGGAATGKKGTDDDVMLPIEYLSSSLAQQSQTPPSKSEQELREEEELQLALALSQSEAESKAKEQKDRGSRAHTYGTRTEKNSNDASTNSGANAPTAVIDTSDMDPELARYLNRNYWEKKKDKNANQTVTVASTTTPSAPAAQTEPTYASTTKVQETYQNGDNDSQEQFLNALRSSVEIFVNRMKSNSTRGRSIANDSSVQTLFMTINQMHPELTKYLQEQEDLRAHYEGLQDKLARLKDAREALDALRADHLEKRRREAEEQERLRQIQMAQKLEVMRQKKQEYLEYQRILAQQRLAEQERELLQRLEQQKQLAHIRHMQQYGFPQAQMYGPQSVQSYSPVGSAEASPIHRYSQPVGGAMYAQPGMGAPMSMPVMMAPPGQMYQGYAPHQAPPQTSQGYWPPMTGYQAQSSGYQAPGMQQQPGTYSGVQNPGMAGHQAVYSTEQQYQAYDMQAMAASLPQQQQQQQQQQPPQNMGAGHHAGQQAPGQAGYGQAGPGGPYSVNPHGQQQYPDAEHQQPGGHGAQLISFD